MGRANDYRAQVRSAQDYGVGADPEAQLTVPVANLFSSVAADHALDDLSLIREARLDGVRPDFAALSDGRPCGWIELKAPGHRLDGEAWVGREKRQWGFLKELDSLIVTDGRFARLYRYGVQVGTTDAQLPWDGDPWDPAEFVTLLRAFASSRPASVRSVHDLASRLAPLAAMLRERLIEHLADGQQAVVNARSAWLRSVHEGASDEVFAGDVAQVISYSLAIAGMSGEADHDEDGRITLGEAREALRGPHALLAASLGPVLGVAGFVESIRFEIGAVERLVSAIDRERIRRTQDSRGEPWLYFYEDFLARYDPEARKQAGVYYTPVPVVSAQVRLTEHVLRQRFGFDLGFADRSVTTLDPATGSGTYPLAVIDAAALRAVEVRGAAGQQMAVRTLQKNLIAFELLPGPYAVAQLRIGRRLAEVEGAAIESPRIRVYLADTLDDPDAGIEVAPGLWGDSETLATERSRAALVRKEERVTVVIGNPPYLRRNAESGGGWVVHPASGRSLFQDLLDAASIRRVNVSGLSAVYNDYVYFWRWAMWKALEQNPTKPAVISFITGSSWLNGPGLVGLRQLARELGDEVWVIDLGGNGRVSTGDLDENVFAIQTPVAIVTVFRVGAPSRATPAGVYYRRVLGSRAEKLAELDTVLSPSESPERWNRLPEPSDFGASLLPASAHTDWLRMPLLTDLFPWQQPGAKFGRAWPISPDPEVLRARWSRLVGSSVPEERAQLFVTGSSGRTIQTRVAGMPTLASLTAGDPGREIVHYAFRPFDRQWTFEDARLAKTESPSLWQSRGPKQIYLVGRITRPFGRGPALHATIFVPDMHAFKGSDGGKDVIPLYRDAAGTAPNVATGLLAKIGEITGNEVSPEALAAYVYALLSGPAYQKQFADELSTIGSRVPITAAGELWEEAVALGEEMLWLHTFAARCAGGVRGAKVERNAQIEWIQGVHAIPSQPSDIRYDAERQVLHVGSGSIAGVTPQVWGYEVTGFEVVRRWFEARTHRGSGRAAGENATTLDRIRSEEWRDEWYDEALQLLSVLTRSVELHAVQESLLSRILDGALIDAADLPAPLSAQRKAPATATQPELEFEE